MHDALPDTEHKRLARTGPLRPFILLARLDRPIGWQLLFWPCAWGVALAGAAFARFDLILWLLLGKDRGALIQPGLPVVIFIIALAGIPYMARIIRGQVLSLREKEFVEAARSLGASDTRILFRHILPNLVAPIIVYTTLIIPTNILFEAALSFLGVGVQPPTPSWGGIINESQSYLTSAPWLVLFPGAAILLTSLGFNLLGEGLRDALDPNGGG